MINELEILFIYQTSFMKYILVTQLLLNFVTKTFI